MMKRLRSLMAAATGAALLVGGMDLPAADAATTGTDFNGLTWSSAFVPSDKAVDVKITGRLKLPASVTEPLSATVTPPGRAARPVAFDFTPVPPKAGAETAVTGKFAIGAADPSGDWKLAVKVVRGLETGSDSFTVKVAPKVQAGKGAVWPTPVRLVKGKDIKISVKAGATGADTVSAKLVTSASRQYYDLGDLERGKDGYFRGVTYFSDDTPPGVWSLEFTAAAGTRKSTGITPFTVVAPTGGATAKARARITIKTPAKVRKGARTTVRGTAYRGSKA
jgi:hypothetical protein